MRTIGHFCGFVGFFLAFASLLGLLLFAAAQVRSPLALLLIAPALLGFYGLYARGSRALLRSPAGRQRSLG